MKSTLKLAVSLALFSCFGNAFAQTESACEAYAREDQFELDPSELVEPAKHPVSKVERGMIQTAILVGDSSSPVSSKAAFDIFTDKAHGGDLAGAIAYYEIAVNGRMQKVARVTYFPGDNEYGALFHVYQVAGSTSASLIGLVGDGDIQCLIYQK